MDDSRRIAVLFGAALLIAALFAPWYAISFSDAARDAISQQAGQLPGAFGDFARGLAQLLPERIVANGWQVFERTDIVLLGCALAAAFSALLGRLDVAALAGGAAVAATLLAIVDKPGPGGSAIVSLQWGPWLALAAAALIVVAAKTGRREPAVAREDWSDATVFPSAAMLADDRPGSVAPPS
jgi:ABC-type transport system involved in cytochrome bd biosynthesis fused ATPase/permease subunit